MFVGPAMICQHLLPIFGLGLGWRLVGQQCDDCPFFSWSQPYVHFSRRIIYACPFSFSSDMLWFACTYCLFWHDGLLDSNATTAHYFFLEPNICPNGNMGRPITAGYMLRNQISVQHYLDMIHIMTDWINPVNNVRNRTHLFLRTWITWSWSGVCRLEPCWYRRNSTLRLLPLESYCRWQHHRRMLMLIYSWISAIADAEGVTSAKSTGGLMVASGLAGSLTGAMTFIGRTAGIVQTKEEKNEVFDRVKVSGR